MIPDGNIPFRIYRANSRTFTQMRKIVQGDPCCYCGMPPRSTADHIIAKHRGGRDVWANLTAACFRCNQNKSDTDLLSFLLSRL